MKRRTFLRMLGLAPVAAALPTMALPRPGNVKDTVKGSVTMGEQRLYEGGITTGTTPQAAIINTDYVVSRKRYERRMSAPSFIDGGLVR